MPASPNNPSIRSAIAEYEARLACYEWPGPADRRERRRSTAPRRQPAARRDSAAAYAPRRHSAATYEPRKGQLHRRRRPRHARQPRVAPGRLLLRRLVALAIAVTVSWALISYSAAMVAPSNVGFGVRSVEWLRDHGFAWLVSDV